MLHILRPGVGLGLALLMRLLLTPPTAHAAATLWAAPVARPGAVTATTTLIITHPMDYVLRNYVTLVREHVLQVPNLRIIGIYDRGEAEDYARAAAYLAREKIDWIELNPVDCDVTAQTVYGHNTCRAAIAPLLAQAGGIIFNGGDDIPPFLYNENTWPTSQVESPQRHIFETAILVQMMGSTRAPDVVPLMAGRPDFTVLGICVGMQTLNIAAGGTLIRDIPSQIYDQPRVEGALAASPATWHHNHAHERGTANNMALGVMHPIHLTPYALPFMIGAGKQGAHEPRVLCIHHQAVDKVGAGYLVYATSDDGKIVEAIGRHDYPNVLGVQFHPERSAMWDAREMQQLSPVSSEHNYVYDTLADDPCSKSLNAGIWAWLAGHIVAPDKHRS